MAGPQLTVKQFAMLALNQPDPPWHLGKLLQIYNTDYMPLKPSIANLSSSQAIIYVSIRSAKTLAGAFPLPDPGETQAQQDVGSIHFWPFTWFGSPDKSDLEEFNKVLAPAGASIVYLSPAQNTQPYDLTPLIPAWVVVGFAGSFGGLASLPAQKLSFDPHNWSSAEMATVRGLTEGTVIVDAAQGSQSALLVPDDGDDPSDWYTWPDPPIDTMFVITGDKQNSDPLGALAIYFANNPSGIQPAQMTAQELLADHLEVYRDTSVRLLLTLSTIGAMSGTGLSDGQEDTLNALTTYAQWLAYLQTVSITDSLPSARVVFGNGSDVALTIPAITLKPVDTSQPSLNISQFVVNSDGTSTGGAVS
jgi:hypothetical protein